MERSRWPVTTGAHGELLVYPEFPVPAGMFVIADEQGEWRTRLSIYDLAILDLVFCCIWGGCELRFAADS